MLKNKRWCLLKRPENLTDKQSVSLRELLKAKPLQRLACEIADTVLGSLVVGSALVSVKQRDTNRQSTGFLKSEGCRQPRRARLKSALPTSSPLLTLFGKICPRLLLMGK